MTPAESAVLRRWHARHWPFAVRFSLAGGIALLLTIWPLPPSWAVYRPEWCLLVVWHHASNRPDRASLLGPWLLGLVLDVLGGGPLGLHALLLPVMTALAVRSAAFFDIFAIWQQAFLLMPTVLVYEMLCFWLHALLGHPMPLHWQALPGSVLAWWPLEWLLQPLWAEDRKPDRLPS
jgi:rod shape-determining protein MreD